MAVKRQKRNAAKTPRPSEIRVFQITPKQWGVFLKNNLLKRFNTKAAAETYAKSIRDRAKKNPLDPIGTFANITVGLASAMQINDMMKKKKPTRRKARTTRKTNGTTTAKHRNPHGDMPSGARFNEKLFDQDLAAIEDGNFRLIRSANAHGKLAGYRKPEIDRLVQRARLAFQLKEMYRRKDNPADIATLLAPLKTNGAFKRMLQRRKAASALKRELKLEHALEKTRAKKRKAIASATANPLTAKRSAIASTKKWYPGRKVSAVSVKENPSRSVGGKKTVTRSANPAPWRKGQKVVVTGGRVIKAGITGTIAAYEPTHQSYHVMTSPKFGLWVKAKDLARVKPTRPVGGKKTVTRSAKSNPIKVYEYHFGKGKKPVVIQAWSRVEAFKSMPLKRRLEFSKLNGGKGGTVTVHDFEKYHTKQNPRATAKKPPRSTNPKSNRIPRRPTFEKFQGRKATSVVRKDVSRFAPAKLDQLGELVEIKLLGKRPWKLNGKKFRLTASRGKLWIAGGKIAKANPQSLANGVDPIGAIDHVVYRTHKPHHGDPPGQLYIHKLGEESGDLPLLCADKDGFPVIRYGKYKIEARGIVN